MLNRLLKTTVFGMDEEDLKNTELETAVYGKNSIRFRNIAGFLAVLTTCICAVFNTYTVHVSVAQNGVWGSGWIIGIMNVGPIICAFAYLSVNKTITTILTGVGGLTHLRNKVANVISTDKKE